MSKHDSFLSRDWQRVFSEELHGIHVVIEDSAQPNVGSSTAVDFERSAPTAFITISGRMKGEIGKVAALRHEHGHLECDSFHLNSSECAKLTQQTLNIIEDVRINIQEAEYDGFRDGYYQARSLGTTKTTKLLWNATQGFAENEDEAYIFGLAQKINGTVGGKHGELRDKAFYREYDKFVRAVVRYIGKPEQKQLGGTSKIMMIGKSPGGESNGGSGSSQSEPGAFSELSEESDKKLTEEEVQDAAAQAAANQPALVFMFAQHDDIAKNGAGQGFGAALGKGPKTPPVDQQIYELVRERFRKLKIMGQRSYEAGIRMNSRVAVRAKFTGETKFFKVPAKEDIRNAKFVVLQDISGSMDAFDVRCNGVGKHRYELAYHFGTAIKEFLTKQGAKVETYRFNDSPFVEGLSLAADGGTSWSHENVERVIGWIREGKQVLIMTDGDIALPYTSEVDSLLRHSGRRPIGLMIGRDSSIISRRCPEWEKFAVINDPTPALDAIVKILSQRFKWAA